MSKFFEPGVEDQREVFDVEEGLGSVQEHGFRTFVGVYFRGFTMGLSDVVPGVSGSTIALLFGIYPRFIRALRQLDLSLLASFFALVTSIFSPARRRKCFEALAVKSKRADLPWLLNLVFGIGSALAVGTVVIPYLMRVYEQATWAFFFGLVLASIIAPLRMMRRIDWRHWVVGSLFFVMFWSLLASRVEAPLTEHEVVVQPGADVTSVLLSQGAELEDLGVELQKGEVNKPLVVTIWRPSLWYIFLAGLVAICAMLLPGISGSFTLLVLGVYATVLASYRLFFSHLFQGDFLHWHAFVIVVNLAGVLLGFIMFSRVMSALLRRLPDFTLSAIIGIMCGCLRVIWPFRTSVVDGASANILPDLSQSGVWFSLLMMVVAGVLVLGLQWYDIRHNGWMVSTSDTRKM